MATYALNVSLAPPTIQSANAVSLPANLILPATPVSFASAPPVDMSAPPVDTPAIPFPITLPLDSTSSAWSLEHSERNVIPSRSRPKVSTALTATRKLGADQRKLKDVELQADITVFLRDREDRIAVLATKHGVTVDKITKLLDNSTNYKQTRAPNLANAKVHFKAIELNGNNNTGPKVSLVDIKRAADADPRLRNLNKEDTKTLIDSIVDLRTLRTTGVRVLNRSAAQDVLAVHERWNTEASNLYERTGARTICFLSRGDVNDTIQSGWISGGDGVSFLRQNLHLDPNDIARMFESWSVSQKHVVRARDSLPALRADVVSMILSGLRFAAQTKNIAMNYISYNDGIVKPHRVKLINWPISVPFVRPSEISTVDELKTLRDELASGSCHWIRLTTRQSAEHAAEVAAKIKAGEVAVPKKRKTRSDKGHKRKASALDESDGDEEDSSEDEEDEGMSAGAVPGEGIIEMQGAMALGDGAASAEQGPLRKKARTKAPVSQATLDAAAAAKLTKATAKAAVKAAKKVATKVANDAVKAATKAATTANAAAARATRAAEKATARTNGARGSKRSSKTAVSRAAAASMVPKLPVSAEFVDSDDE